MVWLSEESLLLAKNWETVDDILRAKKRLCEEMSSLLLSLERELIQQHWWGDGWTFVRYQEAQVYISHQEWWSEGQFLVWIGVEGFTPERVFGTESPPTLYVWIANRQHDLAQLLAEAIEEKTGDVLGEIDRRATGYVIKHAVLKCLPGEVEGYAEAVHQQIIEFFAYYAKVLQKHKELIQDRIEELRSE